MKYLNTDDVPSKSEILNASVESGRSSDSLERRLLRVRVDTADPAQLADVQGLEGAAALTGHPLAAV